METQAIKVGGGHAMEDANPVPSTTKATAESRHKAKRSNAVIILERDGSLVRSGPADHPPNTATGYAELSARAIRQQSSLIDRVLNFAFDTLGLTVLELRVNEQE